MYTTKSAPGWQKIALVAAEPKTTELIDLRESAPPTSMLVMALTGVPPVQSMQ